MDLIIEQHAAVEDLKGKLWLAKSKLALLLGLKDEKGMVAIYPPLEGGYIIPAKKFVELFPNIIPIKVDKKRFVLATSYNGVNFSTTELTVEDLNGIGCRTVTMLK